ncbi:hypothetical protein [Tropicimonas marinistellae]|uniref:hypothetical protein n=1 Tax=Tropicimonas marinistellae TaxID=1739787 RepID=UPI000830EEF1|nr:hypothetical protein [Tropicimonas marinistellae]
MARPRASAVLVAGILGLGAAPAQAEADWTAQLARSVELPSHEWLAKRRREPGAELTPFTTDGCSGGMSSLWTFTAERFPAFAEAHEGIPPWEACCVTHDRAYHTGGPDPDPEASFEARLAADGALKTCVAATADSRDAVLQDLYGLDEAQVRQVYRAISEAMFQAVRLGGGPCTGLPWRWGYGWPQCWEASGE